MSPEEPIVQQYVSRLRRVAGMLRLLRGIEMFFLALFILALAYFVYGRFSFELLPGRELLWHRPAARVLGVSSACSYSLACLLHLMVYGRLGKEFLKYSTAIDKEYAKQGLKRVPIDTTDLIARFNRYLEPSFLSGRLGLKIHILGGLIGIALSLLLGRIIY